MHPQSNAFFSYCLILPWALFFCSLFVHAFIHSHSFSYDFKASWTVSWWVRDLYESSDFHLCNVLGKAMAPHPSILAWKIQWTEEPGGLQSMGSLRVGTTEWLHFHFLLSCTGEGHGNPLQYFCLENPRDGGAQWAAIYGVAQSRTRLKWLSSSSRLKSGRRQWQPTPVLLPGKSYGRRSLVGCSPWGR